MASGIPYMVLRPSLIFGRGDQFCAALAALARRSPIMPIAGDGQRVFQPVWVEDICTCLLKCLDSSSRAIASSCSRQKERKGGYGSPSGRPDGGRPPGAWTKPANPG